MRLYLLDPNAPLRLKSLGVPKTPEALNRQLQRDGERKIRTEERQSKQRAVKFQRTAQQQSAQADRAWQQKRAADAQKRATLRRALDSDPEHAGDTIEHRAIGDEDGEDDSA